MVAVEPSRWFTTTPADSQSIPWNLLRRSPNVENIIEILRGLTRLAHHFVGNVNADYLAKPFGAFADQPGQQARRPSRTASQIEDTFARTKVHQPDRFLGDVEMVALHLRAFAFGGPAVEFVLQLFVGSLGLITHST